MDISNKDVMPVASRQQGFARTYLDADSGARAAGLASRDLIRKRSFVYLYMCVLLVVRTLLEPRRTIIFRGLFLAAVESESNDPPSEPP